MTMIALVHLLVVLVLIKLFRLDRTEAFATLLFGVLIDLDHLFGMVDLVSLQGWRGAFDLDTALASDVQWKSLLHSPIAAIIVAPASLGFKMAVPVLAWGLHLFLDWVQIELLGVLSLPEMLLLVGLVVVLLVLEKRDLDAVGRPHSYRVVVGSLLRQSVDEVAQVWGTLRRTLRLPNMPS